MSAKDAKPSTLFSLSSSTTLGNPRMKNLFDYLRRPKLKKLELLKKLINCVENTFSGKFLPEKKSWSEKLHDSKGLPKVEKITGKMSKRWGTGTVVIPAPMEVDEIMKKVPEGKIVTINDIRAVLAKKHGATIGCPITTGIFAWIAANAAEEEREKGEKNVTPYWRVLKTGGVINEKYPGGVEAQKKLLQREGHKVVQKGKKCVVVDYEKSLAKI